MFRLIPIAAALAPTAGFGATVDERLRSPLDHSFEVAAEGTIDVSTICGKVSVLGTERHAVRITGRLQVDGELLVRSSGDQTHLEVRPLDKRRRDQALCITLNLEVPAGASLEIEGVSTDLEVGAMRGRVSLESVSGGLQLGPGARQAHLESVSGHVHVVGVREELEVETVSGDVSALDIPPRVDVESVSGGVDVAGRLDRVALESVSGKVVVKGPVAPTAQVDIESHSGSVALVLPADTAGSFELASFSGRLAAEGQPGGPVSQIGPGSTWAFVRGDGAARVRVTTFSGDVEIRSR